MSKYLKYGALFAAVAVFPVAAYAQDAGGVNVESILGMVGLSGGAVAIIIAIMRIAEILGKLIPDSASGFLGGLRKGLKIVGGYVTNNSA